MVGRELRTLHEGGAFFEGPRWHDGRWWVSDMHARTVTAIDPDGSAEVVVRVEGRPSGLGWLPDGSLLVVSMTDRRVLRRDPASGEVSVHADLSDLVSTNTNDMVVDEQGRAWVGNFGFDYEREEPKTTVVVRVDPDGTASAAADELFFPNGMVITPDGELVVGETFGSRYTAFTIRGDGALSNRRTWAQLDGFFPDGCCLDAEGHIWSADARSTRCARIAPGGEIVDEVHVPDGHRCFACMLGGDDGRTLLLCAAPSSGLEREGKTDAALYTTVVDVPRGGLP